MGNPSFDLEGQARHIVLEDHGRRRFQVLQARLEERPPLSHHTLDTEGASALHVKREQT